MGYYINLVFDPAKEVYNKEKLSEDFCKNGLIKSSDCAYYNDPDTRLCFFLSFDGISKEWKEKGHWVEIRLSWAIKPEHFRKAIHILLDISKKMNFRVYDPQANHYFEDDNMKNAEEVFAKVSKGVINMLGTVNKTQP